MVVTSSGYLLDTNVVSELLKAALPELTGEFSRSSQLADMLISPLEGADRVMGEVRVKVKFHNALDLALVRRGRCQPAQVRTYEAEALVDTGAVRCVLPSHVVQQLGLQSVGQRVAEYADGRLEAVDLTEPFTLEVLGRTEKEDAMVLGDDVLIGQTALDKLDLVVDCAGRRVMPNPAHPDQPVSKVK